MMIELSEKVYALISDLRGKGIKMKDIAKSSGIQPSVLSALNSTVLPTFIDKSKELDQEEALSYALSQVNNISKKKLIKLLPYLHDRLLFLSSNQITAQKETFFRSLENFACIKDETSLNYAGLYKSYSISSAHDALKIEPFLFRTGENNTIKVWRKSAYNTVNEGAAIFVNRNNLYVLLNESDETYLALVTIFIQLPFYQDADLLRGLYLALDYNRNPVARRILLIKESDKSDENDLSSLDGKIVDQSELTSDLRLYYDYLSGSSDVIKMYSIPFPKFNHEDLIMEKKILSTFSKSQ